MHNNFAMANRFVTDNEYMRVKFGEYYVKQVSVKLQ